MYAFGFYYTLAFILFKGLSGYDGGIKIYNPASLTTYYTAVGDNLTISCETVANRMASVSWCNGETSVNQFAQTCTNFVL